MTCATNSRRRPPTLWIIAIFILLLIFFDSEDLNAGKDTLRKAVPILIAIIEASDEEGGSTITEGEGEQGTEQQIIFTHSAEAGMTIVVWDDLGFPIGDLCIVAAQVNEYGDITDDMAWTNPQTGAATINLSELSEKLSTSLYIDPINHLNQNSVELNSYEFQISTAAYGQKFCFQRSPNIVSNGQYEYTPVNCSDNPNVTISDEASPLTPRQGENNAAPAPRLTPEPTPSPVQMIEAFDYDKKEWDFNNSGQASAGTDMRIEDGALIMNNTISENFKMVRTEIPIERDLKNFAFSADLKSMVQPQNPEDIGRFNLQFRTQDDGRYYNLNIDQNGHSTIYFVYFGEDGLMDHQLVESWRGNEHGYISDLNAVNQILVTVDENSIVVRFNNAEPFNIVDDHKFISEAGGISLALDGSAGNVISYRMDNLTINEWSAD